jgi:hypothetical protein
MRWLASLGTLAASLALLGSSAFAQSIPPANYPCNPQPGCLYPTVPQVVPTPGAGTGTGTGTTPNLMNAPQAQAAPALGAEFSQSAEAGTETASSFAPNMFGDLSTYSIVTRNVQIRTLSTATPVARIKIPTVARSGIKISDNENPRPQDRVFLTYNYFNSINHDINPGIVPRSDLHRETIGFEKTFLEGNASVGMRLPFLQLTGTSGNQIDNNQVGDLSVIFKYAVINDPQSGDVLSGGLLVTAPTGQNVEIGGSNFEPVLLQPYMGYIFNLDKLYVLGFTSVIVPTDSRDVTLLSNDIALGYNLYRADPCGCGSPPLLRGIVPSVEVHVNTPLNHRGTTSTPVGFPDAVSVTSGVRFLIGKCSSLGFAGNVPLTGPNLYDFEGLVQLNIGF